MKTLQLHDFGIFLELAPDEEEKQLLENSPKADFGTLSALKSQIWKSLPIKK